MDTYTIIDCLEKNIPVSFSKYGDGEFACANKNYGANCDNDKYTSKLGDAIRTSFKYMVEHGENAMIGRWHTPEATKFWVSLVGSNKKINWADYHTLLFTSIINDSAFLDKIRLYRTIKDSKKKKIIVCNELLIKSKLLLNLDSLVFVPFNTWFDTKFNEVLQKVIDEIGSSTDHIVLFCCGMAAKVIICELYKRYPKGTYLDIGSGLDLLCTKRDSRGWGMSYDDLYNIFKANGLIDDSWNDPKYDYIYSESKHKLGIHLRK